MGLTLATVACARNGLSSHMAHSKWHRGVSSASTRYFQLGVIFCAPKRKDNLLILLIKTLSIPFAGLHWDYSTVTVEEMMLQYMAGQFRIAPQYSAVY